MTRPVLSDARLREAARVRPSARQLEWQQTEFYGFIHFGMNTMTDREWGLGHEDPALFDPVSVDAEQWVDALAASGMRGIILTCKHHDGFALWPSAVSAHTVASSPWQGGTGDLVADVARACRSRGLKFGVYLSPWDRTEASYGSGETYDDFFVAQLTELLTGYGDLFSVWFDGANGEGPDGRRQLYDWDRYYGVVRELQPGAAISVCGPDVRWCGNEAGATRQDEWSVVPASLRNAERTADRSQKLDDGEFSRAVKSDEDDLGSREALASTRDPFVWYPSEVNTSTRPGWFHHDVEDAEVRSADELFRIYRRSVGGNATFLLNVPPDRRGLVSDADVSALRDLGRLIGDWNESDAAPAAELTASTARESAAVLVGRATEADSWRPDPDDAEPRLTLTWPDAQNVIGVSVREDILGGQLIEGVEVRVPDSSRAGGERVVSSAASVGYQRILDIDSLVTDRLDIVITASRAPASLLGVGVHTAQRGA